MLMFKIIKILLFYYSKQQIIFYQTVNLL